MKESILEADGYEYYADEAGQLTAVSLRTGEVVSTITRTVPYGTTFRTPDAQRAAWEARERRREKYFSGKNENESGEFYFIPSTENFEGLLPASAARMVYLCTFMNYKGQLMLSERTPMTSGDLEEVLGLSYEQAWRFRREATKTGYLLEDGEGNLFPDRKRFRRGKLTKSGRWYRIYCKGVQSLYRAADSGQHKQIGALFSLLPFVNVEHNVLCYNPEEKNFDKIQFMNLRQFCEAIHYNVNGLKRKLRELREITFDVDGHKERFYSVVGDGLNLMESHLYVNPDILYSGSNAEGVRLRGDYKVTD